MFPKEKRLPIAADTFWKGLSRQLPRAARGVRVAVRAGRNALLVNRYAVVVSGRRGMGAVRRNRTKRVLNAELGRADKTLEQGHDILVTVIVPPETPEDETKAKTELAQLLTRTINHKNTRTREQ